MSQQRACGGGATQPLAWPLPSPGRSPGLGWPGCCAWVTALALVAENTFLELASTGGRRAFPPPLSPSPAPVPPHTRPFIFPSCCRTKTPCSLALELEPNGKRSEVGHGSCQAQAGQGMRTPPASSPGPSEGVLCSTLPSGRRVIARGSWEQEFKVMVAVEA